MPLRWAVLVALVAALASCRGPKEPVPAGAGDGPSAVVTGEKIAFVSHRDGNAEIHLMNPDGSDQTNLTRDSGDDWEPAWSPDGAKIAFASDRDGNSEIYVMNADASHQTNLTRHAADDSLPVWSPDGTRIAFLSTRGPGYASANYFLCREAQPPQWLYVMKADGSGQTALTNHQVSRRRVGWSPDGKKIAYDAWPADSREPEIYAINADGTGETRVTRNRESDFDAAWAPDGTKIAFGAVRVPNSEIWVVNADGTGQTNLTEVTGWHRSPVWSPDGSKIAFESRRKADSGWNIYVMNADGSGQTNLTHSPYIDRGPAWSSDGGRLAFASARGGDWEIWAVNLDGAALSNLTRNPAEDLDPQWRPAPTTANQNIGRDSSSADLPMLPIASRAGWIPKSDTREVRLRFEAKCPPGAMGAALAGAIMSG